jgi:hypothetical protein
MPPKRSPGRPPHGIVATHRRILLLLDPALVRRYDRLADRRSLDSGRSVTRHDVMRDALEKYINEVLPVPATRRRASTVRSTPR